MKKLLLALVFLWFHGATQNCECNKWEKQYYSNGALKYDYSYGCNQPGNDYRFIGYDAAYCEKQKQSEKAFKKYQADFKTKTSQKIYKGYTISDYDAFGNPAIGVKTIGKNKEVASWLWDFLETPHKELGTYLKGMLNEDGKAYGVWYFKGHLLPLPEQTNWLREFKAKGLIKEEITMYGLVDTEVNMESVYGRDYSIYFKPEYKLGEKSAIPLSTIKHLLPQAVEEKKEFVRTPKLVIPENLKNGMWVVFKDGQGVEAYDFDPENPKNKSRYLAAQQLALNREKLEIRETEKRDSMDLALKVEKRKRQLSDSLKKAEDLKIKEKERQVHQAFVKKYLATSYDLQKFDSSLSRQVLISEMSLLQNYFDTLTTLLILKMPEYAKNKNISPDRKILFNGLEFYMSADFLSFEYTDNSEWKIYSEFTPANEKVNQYTILPILNILNRDKNQLNLLDSKNKKHFEYLLKSKYVVIDGDKSFNVKALYGDKITSLKTGAVKIKKTKNGFKYILGTLPPHFEPSLNAFLTSVEKGSYIIKYSALSVTGFPETYSYRILGKEE